MPGLYIVFEGSDGSGKSTTMTAVAEALTKTFGPLPICLTNHPGSTPLGKHIRKLVKFPEQIDVDIKIDDLSRQVLYMVDTISFVRSILEPTLAKDGIVFADRSSFISALVYGTADGLALTDIARLFQLITPPRIDRLYVMRCPWQVSQKRMGGTRTVLDHYDKKSIDFLKKIEEIYDNLITGPAARTVLISRSVAADNVMYVDATMSLDQVVSFVVADLRKIMEERGVLPLA